MNNNGYFGVPQAEVPAGYHYHSNGSNGFGFVADYRKNGFTGQYGGDYFTPGSPYEGFYVRFNGHLLGNDGNGTVGIPSASLVETSAGTTHSAVWTGHRDQWLGPAQDHPDLQLQDRGPLLHRQRPAHQRGHHHPLRRTLRALRRSGQRRDLAVRQLHTVNHLVYQTPNAANQALVTSTGTVVTDMTLGLGAIDSRAKVSASCSSDPSNIIDSPVGDNTSDTWVGLGFDIGTLAPGQSASFDYAYILSASDLGTALGSLAAVTILQPTGTISGTSVPFSVTTNDVAHTSQVDFYLNGALIGSSTTPVGGNFSTSFNSTTYPNGSLAVKAVATINGTPIEKASTVVVDNSGPPMSFTAPVNGATVSGGSIAAAVSIDALNPPTSVVFYREVSGKPTVTLGTVTSAPFQTTFSVTDLTAGTAVTIRAVGTNASGKTTNLTVGVTVAAVPPTGITVSGGTAGFVYPNGAIAVDASVIVEAPSNLDNATVAIASGFVAGQDVLACTPSGGITCSYNATTGILTLTGNASAAAYQAVLRTVTYDNSAGASANTGARTVSFSLGSGLNYPANGHFYEFVSSASITWDAANTAASARRYFGLVGYLATVTSQGENDFIAGKLTGQGWMGLTTPSTSVPRDWSWATGPEAGTAIFHQTAQCPSPGGGTVIGGHYTNWASGEPNNCTAETKGHFLVGGQWNDYAPDNTSITGYVVEYGGMAGDPTVTLSGSRALSVTISAFPVTFATDGTTGTSLTGTTSQTIVAGGSTTPVTAVPSATTYFVNWTGTGGFVTTTTNPITVTGVTGAMALTAHFAAKTATTTTVASSAPGAVWGQAVSFTATVTPSSATGTVQFQIGGVNLGTPVTVSGGVATSGATSALSVGGHAVTAVYSGDVTHLGGSGSLTQNIAKSATSVALSAPATTTYGAAVTLTATLSVTAPGAGTPTGTVTFTAGGIEPERLPGRHRLRRHHRLLHHPPHPGGGPHRARRRLLG